MKYGAPILDQDSMPPAKVEVAVDLIQMGMVEVGVSEFVPKVFDCWSQSYDAPPPAAAQESVPLPSVVMTLPFEPPGMWRFEMLVMVEEAVERKPFKKPSVVEVETP